MTDDLFSAGFAWADDDVADDATPVATPARRRKAAENVGISDIFAPAVAGVADVAETEGQRLERLLSQPAVARTATMGATPEMADFCGVEPYALPPVADVASVAEWRKGVKYLSLLRHLPPPYHSRGWRTLIDDATAFLNNWGDDAVRWGWSTLDVFGTNPTVGARRYDRLGLVVLLGGRPVQSLEPDRAWTGSGNDLLQYRRTPKLPGAVPLWAVKGEAEC